MKRVATLKYLPYSEYLKTDHWRAVRRAAIDHYGRRCLLCGATDASVNVHHRTYDRLGRERLHDLTVLCRDCHAAHHEEPSRKKYGEPTLREIREHFERLIASETEAA